jgi:hypothetical protein
MIDVGGHGGLPHCNRWVRALWCGRLGPADSLRSSDDEVDDMERSWAGRIVLGCLGLALGRPSMAGPVNYSREIQPILNQRCLECHGPRKQESGLRLDRFADVIRGGDRGPAVIAGRGAESLLYRAVSRASEDVDPMPPQGKPLTNEQIELIRRWIDEGAKGATDPAPRRTGTDRQEGARHSGTAEG